jgi:PAS domain S-box-containing protein
MKPMRKIKILYVEDDIAHANLIVKMLSKCQHINYEVEHRGDLKSSIEYLKSIDCDVDVILLDLMLPNSRGIDTFKEIYNVCIKVPIVILSGFEDIARDCIEFGAQDYLIKPDITPTLVSRSLQYAIERKKLLDKQLRLEKRFSSVIQATPLGVHMYELSDGELYFCGYNKAADEILKIDHSEFLGMEIEHAFPDLKGIKNEYIKVIKTGEPWTNRCVDYEDDKIKGSFSIYAFRTEENKMATSFEDITVKTQMQRALRTSQERFKLLSDANFEGVTVTKDAIVIDANKQMCEMLECELSDIVGKPIIEFVSEEDRDMVFNNIRNNYERPYEHNAMKKDGTIFPVEIHGRTLPDGMRLTAVRNMTRYREAEDRYRELVEATGASVYEIDFKTMKFTYVNDVLCKLSGWSKSEFMELGPDDVLTKESGKQFAERIKNLEEGKYISSSHEYQIKVKDGSFRWTVITAKYREDKDGNIIGASAIAIDITETKKAQIEAEEKEEIIFNHLELKIQEWRKEISLKSIATKAKLDEISLNINSMVNSEVW